MKVVIKLNSVQINKLKKLVEEHNVDLSGVEQEKIVTCGDVLMYDHGFSFNSNQSLKIGLNEVTLEGERCPLSQDGIFQLIGSIDSEVEELFASQQWSLAWCKAKEFFSTLAVREYKTSDRKLKWYQTLEQYMSELNNEELLEALEVLPRERFEVYVIHEVGWCDVKKCRWTLFEFTDRFQYITKIENEVKAAAVLTPTELKVWRKFRAVRAERLKSWGY